MNKKFKILIFAILTIILLYASIVIYIADRNGDFENKTNTTCSISIPINFTINKTNQMNVKSYEKEK